MFCPIPYIPEVILRCAWCPISTLRAAMEIVPVSSKMRTLARLEWLVHRIPSAFEGRRSEEVELLQALNKTFEEFAVLKALLLVDGVLLILLVSLNHEFSVAIFCRDIGASQLVMDYMAYPKTGLSVQIVQHIGPRTIQVWCV